MLLTDDPKVQAAFVCVLSEAFNYETPQQAYEAYCLAYYNRDKTLEELGIKLTGLFLHTDLVTCDDLVGNFQYVVGNLAISNDYYVEFTEGKHQSIVEPKNIERFYLPE